MSDWWSKKLNGGQQVPPSRPAGAPTSPLPNIRYVPEGNVTSTPVSYDPNEDTFVTKAQTARMNDKCPGCYSGNYFAPQGTEKKRCYDCGYPIVQSGSGAGMPSGSAGPTQAAKQVHSGNNFNMNTIVGRIE